MYINKKKKNNGLCNIGYINENIGFNNFNPYVKVVHENMGPLISYLEIIDTS